MQKLNHRNERMRNWSMSDSKKHIEFSSENQQGIELSLLVDLGMNQKHHTSNPCDLRVAAVFPSGQQFSIFVFCRSVSPVKVLLPQAGKT